MKRIHISISCYAFILMAVWGCDRSAPIAPVASTLDSTLLLPVSTLTVPIRYHVDSLQKTINEKVSGTFVKQWLEVNNQHDSLYLELTRRSPIQLAWRNTTLLYRFPLHIEGKFIKHIGKRITLKNETPVAMDVVLHMSTDLSLAKDWGLTSATTLHKIEWVREPELKIAFVTVNLRKKLEALLDEKEQTLTQLVDNQLTRLIDTKSIVEKLWVDIQKPIALNKIKTKVWLKHRAEGLRASLLQDGKYVGVDIHLTTRAHTVLEGEEMPASNVELPAYNPIVQKSDSIELFVLASAPFKYINSLLNAELKGKVLEQNGYAATVRSVKAYGTSDGLALSITLDGDAKGTFYVHGTPLYEPTTNRLEIQNFDFDIDSENTLVQSANWLLHDDVLKEVQGKLSIELQPFVEQLPETIRAAVERGKSGEKMELFITSLTAKPHHILITKNDIQVLLKAEGKAVIGLQKEVFVKKGHKKTR